MRGMKKKMNVLLKLFDYHVHVQYHLHQLEVPPNFYSNVRKQS